MNLVSRPGVTRGGATHLRRVLLLCVREGGSPQAQALLAEVIHRRVDLDALTTLAAWHRVDGYVWLGVRGVRSSLTWNLDERDAQALMRLEAAYLSSVARHLKTLADVRTLTEVLDAAGITFAVLKGPALAELAYRRPDLRSYHDLDVLVAPDQLGDAIHHIERLGSGILDANWDLMARLKVGELRMQLHGGTVLDLHWSLFNDAAVRAAFAVDTRGLLDRAIRMPLRGQLVPVLDATDAVMHAAVHACMAGANKLGWLKDVEQSLVNRFDGWPDLVARSREWRATTAIATVLVRADRVLGTTVPGGVLDELAPRAWRALVVVVDRLSPTPGSTAEASLSRVVARSARSGLFASWIELARRSGAHVARFVRLAKAPPPWDPTNRASAAFPSGERARFLASVTGLASRRGDNSDRR